MHLSLRVQYAICGVFDLAYHGHGGPVQIRVISERQQIPARYLEQIFQRLRRAKLVTSKRGPGGGYSLARPASEITLREVVEAIAGGLVDALRMPPPRGGSAAARPSFLWSSLADRFAGVLEETSVQGLCVEAARARVPREEPASPMYYI
jgi:Rrf2 family protein